MIYFGPGEFIKDVFFSTVTDILGERKLRVLPKGKKTYDFPISATILNWPSPLVDKLIYDAMALFPCNGFISMQWLSFHCYSHHF